VQLERRSGDPSAVAGAFIFAYLSNLRQDLTRWKSPYQTSSKPHQGADVSIHTVLPDGTEIELDGLGNSTPNMGNDKAADAEACNKNTPMDCDPADVGAEPGNVKFSGVNDLLRPFSRILAGSTTCKLKLSKISVNRYWKKEMGRRTHKLHRLRVHLYAAQFLKKRLMLQYWMEKNKRCPLTTSHTI